MKKIILPLLVLTPFLLSACSKDTATSGQSTSAVQSGQVTSSSSKATEKTSTVKNETSEPNAVKLNASQVPLVFHFKGMNVPKTMTINDVGITSVTFQKTNGENITYKSSVSTIPTKSIQIFSAGTNQIRTVKVNTQITLNQKLSGSSNVSGPLYLFYNLQGGISLIAPNDAGNGSEDQRSAMLEVLP